jgi:uncharacterized protein YutE (UPF0331/DUF86 family)
MVDPGRVRRLLDALARCRRLLEPLRDLQTEVYVREEAFSGRYLVQACAQCCIDIANHVIASSGWRTPSDFADAFTVLEENRVLDSELAKRMRRLAGLRNRLVHIYEEIDDRIVHESLAEGLQDLSLYARAVARLVDGDPSPPGETSPVS